MKKTVISLILITILSKMVGFARDIALAYYYGTTNISDVFLVSLTIPTVIFAFIGAGISTAYIPMYNRIALNQGETEANIYTNNLMHNILIICMFLVLFGFLFTDKIVLLFASGFSGETLILASHFTRITLIALFFTGLVYVFQGFLQIKVSVK